MTVHEVLPSRFNASISSLRYIQYLQLMYSVRNSFLSYVFVKEWQSYTRSSFCFKNTSTDNGTIMKLLWRNDGYTCRSQSGIW